MSQTTPKENKMGVQPIGSLLAGMALPMMAGMLVQALYNVVDSVFVSHLSENALTAVSLAFPVQNLMIAVSVGTAIGVNALVSRCLGEKQFEQADRTANNGILLALCSTVLFMLFGIFGTGMFFSKQVSDPEIMSYGIQYTFIVCVFSQGLFLQIMLEKLLNSTGKTVYSMLLQLAGAVINIILDPILIFGLFGLPALGVAGAALATVIGQWGAAAIALLFNVTKNKELHFGLRQMRPDGQVIRRIYAIAAPSIAMQSVGSIMVFGMNRILLAFTSTAAAVFGVYFKLQSFIFMPVFGLNSSIVPIVSYNYGAHKPERMVGAIKMGMLWASCIMLAGFAAFQLAPTWLLELFDASPTMMALGVPALRIISVSFLMAGINIVASSVFQALGHGMLSLWISVGRQLAALLPLAWLLSLTGDLDLVWLAFPGSELLAIAMSAVFLRRVYREAIQPMLDGDKPLGPELEH